MIDLREPTAVTGRHAEELVDSARASDDVVAEAIALAFGMFAPPETVERVEPRPAPTAPLPPPQPLVPTPPPFTGLAPPPTVIVAPEVSTPLAPPPLAPPFTPVQPPPFTPAPTQAPTAPPPPPTPPGPPPSPPTVAPQAPAPVITAPREQHTPRTSIAAPLRSMLRERRRLVLSMVAVALGVGYLAGSLSLLDRVGEGLARQSGVGSEPADLIIEGSVSLDSPLEYVRRLVPSSLVESVRSIPGVAAAEVRIESPTVIIPDSSDAVVSLGLTERPLGTNWIADRGLTPYRIAAPGVPPVGDDEVVIDANSAAISGIDIGDRVRIAAKTTTRPFRVTGILDESSSGTADGSASTTKPDSSIALFALPVAQSLFELTTDATAIVIRVDPQADIDQVRADLTRILPFGTELSDAETYSEHRLEARSKGFTLIRILLAAFAVLAVTIAGFTVANSMVLLFDHRRRSFALFRLVGASTSTLRWAAATEAAIAGAIAGFIGAVLGIGIGWLIEAGLRGLDTTVPTAGPPVTWWVPPTAVVAGVVVTALVSLTPARSAARSQPVEAVQTGVAVPVPAARAWLTRLAGIAAAALCAGAVAALSTSPTTGGIVAGAVAMALILISAVGTALGRLVTLTASWFLRSQIGLRRMVAARSAQSRRRTVATTGALAVAVTVVTGLAVLSTSFVASLDGAVSDTVRADLVVDSGTLTVGGLPADLIPALRDLDGVERVTGWRIGSATISTSVLRVGGVDGASVFELLDLDLLGAKPAELPSDGVALSESAATALGLSVGDRADVAFATSVRPMRITAIYRSPLRLLLGDALVDTKVLAAELGQSVDAFAFVQLSNPNDRAAEKIVIDTALAGGAKTVIKPEELIDSRVAIIRGFGRVIQWMLLFTVLLALIGVANTLQLGVWERRREIGLLRAIGATRGQIVSLVVAEAAAMSVIGMVVGLLSGVGLGVLAVVTLGDFGLTTLAVPPATLASVAFAALALGLVGAALPALRAATTPALDAIDGHDNATGLRPPRQTRTADVDAPRPSTELVPIFLHPLHDPTPNPSPHRVAAVSNGISPNLTVDIASAHLEDQDPTAPLPMNEICFQCGEETGYGERCARCGAPRVVPAAALFSTGGDTTVPVVPPPPPPPPPPPLPPEAPSMRSEPSAGGASFATQHSPAPDGPMFAVDGTFVDDEITDAEIVDELIGDHAPVDPPHAMFSATNEAFEPPIVRDADLDHEAHSEPAHDGPPTPDQDVNGTSRVHDAGETWLASAPNGSATDSPGADDAAAAATLGSIFATPPEPAEDPASRSPFGQFANETDPTATGRWSTLDPEDEAIDAAAERARRRKAAAPPPTEPTPSPSYVTPPMTAPPPAYRTSRSNPPEPAAPATPMLGAAPFIAGPAAVDPTLIQPPAQPIEPDEHGLAGAIQRLSAGASAQSTVAFAVAGVLLGDNESVIGAVSGISLGHPTGIVVTTDRVLVVLDRRWVPYVEEFALTNDLQVHGRHHQGTATLTLSDRERLVTVEQIADVVVAIEIAATVRSMASGSEF